MHIILCHWGLAALESHSESIHTKSHSQRIAEAKVRENQSVRRTSKINSSTIVSKRAYSDSCNIKGSRQP